MLTRLFFVTAPNKVSKKGAKKGMGKKSSKKEVNKKGAKKGMRKKSSKKEVKSPAPSATQIDVPTGTPVVTSTPSMPVVVPTASPIETAQPTTRPTPPAGSPTMVPIITPAVTPVPTPVAVTNAPSPADASGAPTPAVVTNVPTPAIDTGTPTESPEATDVPTAAPVEASGAPTPAVISGAPTPAIETNAPTPAIGTGTPTPAVVSGAPTPLIETNVPTPAIGTGTPTESPTISLGLGGPTPSPTPLVEPEATDVPTAAPVAASGAPTPAIDTGAPTPAVVSGAPTPLIETNVPTPAIDTEQPTVAPVGTSVPTAAPMIPTGGIPVDASPFSVTYETVGADPTEAQFTDAERITREYLEQFFVDFFEFSFEGEYVSLSVGVLENTVGPPRIGYNLTAFFLPGAEAIPTEEEIDIVVQTAFSQPSVQTLILELRTLAMENPFSSTSTVSYSIEPMAAPLTTLSDSTGLTVPAVLIGMAAGFGALACIITAIFAARRRSRYRSIKQSLLPGMPYNSNIMAFMDRELGTSRSFSSSQSSRSLHRNEI
jgi:hypothetical protein